jgi:glycosyltransferase involved in cell wall biosynthesis
MHVDIRLSSLKSLSYVTAINLDGSGAQSKQVVAVVQGFAQHSVTTLFAPHVATPSRQESPETYRFKPLAAFTRPRVLRQLCVALQAVVLSQRDTLVYAREILIACIAAVAGRSAIYEIHHELHDALGRMLLRFFKNRIHIVAISQALANYVVQELGIARERVIVAHDGVNLQHFQVPAADLTTRVGVLRAEAPKALYVGSLYPGRGIEHIIAAAQQCPHIDFIVIGGTREEQNRYRSLARTENLFMVPAVPHCEVPALLLSADLLLMPYTRAVPTHKYMSPLKMFEYMATGRPIVAPRLGPITEVLSDDCAYLYESESSDDFIRAIREATSAPEENALRARRALELVTREYTWEKRAERVLAYYDCSFMSKQL